jgi:hypothetical protein
MVHFQSHVDVKGVPGAKLPIAELGCRTVSRTGKKKGVIP